tara:strand:+ start:143289 stop:144653 length:1365 start_codon:yes stop_codon:yes gene_type:complete
MSQITQSKVHFIGIGGIGMSGIAELLHNMGAEVSGSDQSDNDQTQRLTSMGVEVFKGHRSEQVESADVVVYSSAVQPENVEFARAVEMKIPIIGRAEALAEIMRLKRGVAIAGTHGKTTTTSFTAQIFLEAQLDPTIVVGGRLDVIKSNAKLGAGEWLVAEADESDGSFLRLSPELAVITNVDYDHLDFYGSKENVEAGFRQFADRIPFYGHIVVCGDDVALLKCLSEFRKPISTYGFSESCDYKLVGENSKYEIFFQNESLGKIEMPLPGQHNALNALAAMIVAEKAGIPFSVSISAIESFAGVDRRLQKKGIFGGVEFYDDYGHHPTEVKAVLSSLKEKYPSKELHVIFQPHRYSRTRDCWAEFTQCFEAADHLYLLDIYPAGEQPLDGISSTELHKSIPLKGKTLVNELDPADIVSQLLADMQWKEGDVVLTLGAGNVSRIGDLLRGRLNS